jgi:hypothetical protein
VNRRTGERRSLTAFVDGEFTAIAVRPGDYEVVVERSTLERLGATAPPVRFTLVPQADGATVSGVRVVVEPGVTSGGAVAEPGTPDGGPPAP